MLADVLCKYREDGVVVLEEGTGRVDELKVVYVFGGFVIGICYASLSVNMITSILDDRIIFIFF